MEKYKVGKKLECIRDYTLEFNEVLEPTIAFKKGKKYEICEIEYDETHPYLLIDEDNEYHNLTEQDLDYYFNDRRDKLERIMRCDTTLATY